MERRLAHCKRPQLVGGVGSLHVIMWLRWQTATASHKAGRHICMYCTARYCDCCLFVSDFAVANIFVQESMCVAFPWRWCRPNVVLVRQTIPIVCCSSRRVLCVNACGLVYRCTYNQRQILQPATIITTPAPYQHTDSESSSCGHRHGWVASTIVGERACDWPRPADVEQWNNREQIYKNADLMCKYVYIRFTYSVLRMQSWRLCSIFAHILRALSLSLSVRVHTSRMPRSCSEEEKKGWQWLWW